MKYTFLRPIANGDAHPTGIIEIDTKEVLKENSSILEVMDFINKTTKTLKDKNKQLLEMINAIPCTCDEAYKSRHLIAPDCPRCNYVDEDLITGKKPEEHDV
jgi:hypothetical protein